MKYRNINLENVNLDVDDGLLIRDKESGQILYLTIMQDENPESPREWDNVCTIVSGGRGWNISDEGFSLGERGFIDFLKNILQKDCPDVEDQETIGDILACDNVSNQIVCKPIYMYEHGGQTISLSPFFDRFDSGVCGYIICTKQKALKELDCTQEDWCEKVERVMKDEIEVYDNYITGEVYGYKIEEKIEIEHRNTKTGAKWTSEDFDIIDSCYGYYGYKNIKSMVKDALGDSYEVVEEVKESENN